MPGSTDSCEISFQETTVAPLLTPVESILHETAAEHRKEKPIPITNTTDAKNSDPKDIPSVEKTITQTRKTNIPTTRINFSGDIFSSI